MLEGTTTERERSKGEYSRIVTQLQPLLIHRAMSLTRDSDVAYDLVQSTLERGWRAFGRLRPGSNPTSWLFTIMTRRFIDDFRHANAIRFWRCLDQIDVPSPMPDEEPHWAAFDMGDVARAAEGMPASFREPFELRAFARLSYRQIAERLDLPINTVASRIHRAREYLRHRLTSSLGN